MRWVVLVGIIGAILIRIFNEKVGILLCRLVVIGCAIYWSVTTLGGLHSVHSIGDIFWIFWGIIGFMFFLFIILAFLNILWIPLLVPFFWLCGIPFTYGDRRWDRSSPGALVESSLIYGVHYDPDIQELTVVSESTGGMYVYEGVPQEFYDALMAAESQGKFFTKHIENRFKWRQVNDLQKEAGS
jgi:hypothetical protein